MQVKIHSCIHLGTCPSDLYREVQVVVLIKGGHVTLMYMYNVYELHVHVHLLLGCKICLSKDKLITVHIILVIVCCCCCCCCLFILLLFVSSARLAFCGRTGHMSVEFPFTDYLPKEQRVNFTAHVSTNTGLQY